MAWAYRLRGGTAAEGEAANPVLAQREPAVEYDTGRLKIGDGVTPWNDLPYVDAYASTVMPLVVATEDYEATDADAVIVAAEGCTAVTLSAAYGNAGRSVTVKATTASVAVAGVEDIDTGASVQLRPWEAITLVSTGAQWVIV